MQNLLTLRKIVSLAVLTIISIASVTLAEAQKPGGGGGSSGANQNAGASQTQAGQQGAGGSGGGGGGSGAGSALQGVSFSRGSWDQLTSLPPPETFSFHSIATKYDNLGWPQSYRKSVLIFCYTLAENLSGTNPFILEPTKPDRAHLVDPGKHELCTNQVKSSHKAVSLIGGRYLVFRIDMSNIPAEVLGRIQTINLNVTSQSGSSLNSQRGSTINPTTERPSMALLSERRLRYCANPKQGALSEYQVAGQPLGDAFCNDAKLEDEEKDKKVVLYLAWPGPLVADTIASVSANVIYTPVPTAVPWKGNTFYPAGSIVISETDKGTNGHYYLSLKPGISGSDPKKILFDTDLVPVRQFEEGGVYWRDVGETEGSFDSWKAHHTYAQREHIRVSRETGKDHLFEAETGGVSGATKPGRLKTTKIHDVVYDSDRSTTGLSWERIGPICQQSTPPGSSGSGGGNSATTSGGGVNSASSLKIPSLGEWKKDTTYNMGDLIEPPVPGNCHYYQARKDGTSGTEPPEFPIGATQVYDGHDKDEKNVKCPVNAKVRDGVCWQDMGFFSIPAWAQNTAYAEGNYVTPSAANGFFYKALNSGVSGSVAPAFPLDGDAPVVESAGLIWLDLGPGSTPPQAIKTLKKWSPNTPYVLTDGLFDPDTGHYYLAIQPGISGSDEPPFDVPAPQVVTDSGSSPQNVEWQDLGTTLPASASLGTQPSDQTVNVLNLTYPQIQLLGRFNLTSGVVMTSVRPPSITSYTGSGPTPANKNSGAPATTGTGCPTGITSCTVYAWSKGSHLIDPVLGVTVYAIPLDAERPYRWADMFPAPTLNISLSSPTSNFHTGFSSEFLIRNLQIVYGASFVQQSRLGLPITSVGAQMTSIYTTKKFTTGGFVGFTFNISGFIQALIP
jgi:hypothetical protein